MEEQITMATPKPKKKYIRKRRTDLALEVALRDAATAVERGAEPATMNLIQTRLNVLSNQLARERNDKLKRTMAEVERLRQENDKLKADMETALTTPTSVKLDLDAQAQEMLRRLQD